MKIFSLIFFLFVSIFQIYAQSESLLADIIGDMQEKAKQMDKSRIVRNRIKYCNIHITELTKNRREYLSSKISYDEKGNIIEIIDYDAGGQKSWIWLFQYKDDKLIEKVSKFPDGSLSMKESYEYDNKNRLIKLIVYDSDNKISSKKRYKYSDEGKIIKEEKSEEDLSQKTEFKYNETGNILSVFIIGGNQKKFLIYNVDYDLNNNIILEEKFGIDGKLEYRFKSEYDDNNNKINMTTWDSKKMEPKNTLSYKYEFY